MINDLGVIDLYESKKLKKVDDFMGGSNSALRVRTDYEKVKVDINWIDLVEDTIPRLDAIFRNPNRFIINDEEIVKIELAKRITVESIKHLSRNTNMIQDYDEKTDEVKPSKILNVNKEESYDTYENKFIYSLIQNLKVFIAKKKKALEEAQTDSEKNDKQLDYTGSTKIFNEIVNIDLHLNTKLDSSAKIQKEEIFQRIKKVEEKLLDITNLEVYRILDKLHMSLVTSPIKKTNVILKNTNFQYAVKLWNYIQDHINDRTEEIKQKLDYMDNDKLKQMVDETFLLNYLTVSTLDKDRSDLDEEEKNLIEKATNNMLDKIIEMNSNMSEKELKDLIGKRFDLSRAKSVATIAEIQKIFRKHIDKYLKGIVINHA